MSEPKKYNRALPLVAGLIVVIATILWFASQQNPLGDVDTSRGAPRAYEQAMASRIARDAMPLAETARNIGVRDVTVEFQVGAVAADGEAVLLTDAASPGQLFTVVMMGADGSSLLSVADAEEVFLNRWVKVSGDIEEYSGSDGVQTPHIRVTDHTQVTVID